MTKSADKAHARRDEPARACPWDKRWDSWELEQLRAMAGRMTIREIVAALNREFAGLRPPRNENGVVIAGRRHGVDLVLRTALSLREVERILHADHRMIRKWIDQGLLTGRQFHPGLCGSGWAVEPEDLRRFLEEHSYAYDWTVMPRSPWRTLAETVALRTRWRTRSDLAAYLGYASLTFWKNHHAWIPHKRRWHNSAPNQGSALIRADDFPAIEAAIRRLEHQHNQAALDGRHARARKAAWRDTWQRSCGCGWIAHGKWSNPPPEACSHCGELLLTGRRFRGRRVQAAA